MITLNNSEWSILDILWQGSPRKLMDLVHAMKKKQGWSKSTTNTVVKRMVEKQYLSYQEGEKARLYYPLLKREDVIREETDQLIARAYSGRLGSFLNALISDRELSKAEIEELRDILHEKEEKGEV